MHAVASRFARSACLVAAVFLAVACHGSSGHDVLTPTPTVRSIDIVGMVPLERPGATAQLNAIATYFDGSTKNVTFEATWTGVPGVATVSAGLVTAVGYGSGNLTATCNGVARGTPVRVVPAGAFLVTGTVAASGFPLPQARVEAASAAGTFSTLTGNAGAYTLPASGDTTWTVTRDGFDAQVRQETILGDQKLLFDLTPLGTAVNILGEYTLTITASPSCALPANAATRTYRAEVVEGRTLGVNSDLVVVLSGGNLLGWWNFAGFVGTRAGSTVLFAITDDLDMDVALVEVLPDGTVLYVSGQGSAALSPGLGTGTFSGRLVVRRNPGFVTVGECTAPDHRLQFTR